MNVRARRAIGLIADALDPLTAVGRLPLMAPATTLVSIYRYQNAAHIERLVRDVGDMPVRLWALDAPISSLEHLTRGVGPGGRFELLNRLALGVPSDHWLLVADDDVVFRTGGLRAFLALAARFRLDIAQPAHARRGSYYYHRITRRHPFRVGRETTFVEIGPVLAISPAARPQVNPFPTDGMGWGTELLWHEMQEAGLRLGIIDATPLRHLAPIATTYDMTMENRRLQQIFADRGISGWEPVQRNIRSLYS